MNTFVIVVSIEKSLFRIRNDHQIDVAFSALRASGKRAEQVNFFGLVFLEHRKKTIFYLIDFIFGSIFSHRHSLRYRSLLIIFQDRGKNSKIILAQRRKGAKNYEKTLWGALRSFDLRMAPVFSAFLARSATHSLKFLASLRLCARFVIGFFRQSWRGCRPPRCCPAHPG